MYNINTTGSWLSYLMTLLFFLLIATAVPPLVGVDGTIPAFVHKGAGVIFICLFLIDSIATCHQYATTRWRRRYTYLGSTTYHILRRQNPPLQ